MFEEDISGKRRIRKRTLRGKEKTL